MTTEIAPRRAHGERRRVRGPTIAGIVCLVVGLGALGWSAVDLFWRSPVDPRVAAATASDLRERWAQPASEASGQGHRPLPGEAVALLRLPAPGDVEQPVLVGTDAETLTRGVGWYEGTAAPGEVGNFAVAGHGGLTGPLAALRDLRAGDRVVVETRAAVLTYELTNDPASTTVRATDTWVIQPVPGRPEVRPTEALITLTTSQDLIASADRTVGFGTLVATEAK